MNEASAPTSFWEKHPAFYTLWIAVKLWIYILFLFTATEAAQVVYQQF
jgi:low affinity Fe/Cu permease